MNVTKDVIIDLYPLYAEKECSADTRALVEDYLQRNPHHAEEFRLIMGAKLPAKMPSAGDLEEVKSLRRARRNVRRRGFVMGIAIFASLCPFSVSFDGVKTHWMFLESPIEAGIFAAFAVLCWTGYFAMRKRSNTL